MQLVAYGAQDVYLTGNPQITFFKVVYRRHTNFSMESIQQTFNGTTSPGSKVTTTISRNGDLIHKMYVDMKIRQTFGYIADNAAENSKKVLNVENIGHFLIDNVEIEIGGQKIDKHYNKWLEIWSDLTVTKSKSDGFQEMIDASATQAWKDAEAATKYTEKRLYVPLQFWFCRNPGLALPLIALQYHEVKVSIQWAGTTDIKNAAVPTGFETDLANGVGSDTSVTFEDSSLYVDYIYLDTDERRRFAQVSHEYLIEQLQFTGADDIADSKHRLNFNHPVKELIWVGIDNTVNATTKTAWNKYLKLTNAKLQLNGHDRFSEREASYFSLVQPYQHHTAIPMTSEGGSGHVHVYSFALKPEDHQPSGTCNFSRIDNATLNVDAPIVPPGDTQQLYIYAVNYNVLRIMGGMGGLAYSN
jgi:hypothetical protein